MLMQNVWIFALLSVVWGLPESVSPNSYTTCLDLDCRQFPRKNALFDKALDFSTILIDKTNDKVLVGARDYVFRLDPKTLKTTNGDDVLYLKNDETMREECHLNKGRPKDECHNFIRVLDYDSDGNLFVCGTYSYSPRCWKISPQGPLRPFTNFSGESRSPFGPNFNSTTVFNDGFMFSGITGVNTKDTAIFRLKTDPNIRGVISSYRAKSFLNEPNFVSSFSYLDNFVYFVFRETALEEEEVNNRKVVYSRIARVCKYDTGGPVLLMDKFTSFIKTRLSCSVPGRFPFYYDNVQGTFLVKGPSADKSYLYAVFTTPELGAAGSAVCKYSLKEIHRIFQSSDYKIKSEDRPSCNWLPKTPPFGVTDPGRPKCDSSLDTTKYDIDIVSYAKDHSLLYDDIKEEGGTPIFTKNDVRFTQVVVDEVSLTPSEVIPVIFIGTSNGVIFKLFSMPAVSSLPFVVEQIQVFEDEQPIQSMKLHEGAVYVGGDLSVKRVPVQKCTQYITCRTCIIARDPYCGWSTGGCMTKATSGSSEWHQDIKGGNFSKICPAAPPRCKVSVIEDTAYDVARLECAADGIPLPSVYEWSRQGKTLPTSSEDAEIVKMKEGWKQQYVIKKFTPVHSGEYECHVKTAQGTATCSTTLKGSLPEISSGFYKDPNTQVTQFWCEATGYPAPSFFIHKKSSQDVDLAFESRVLDISPEQGKLQYYCIGQNSFGPSVGPTSSVEGRQVDVSFKITSQSWSRELRNENSSAYKNLVEQISQSISVVYKDDYKYLGAGKMVFSKGSVICNTKLDFITPAEDRNSGLLTLLQVAVNKGKISDLSVDSDYVLFKDKESDTLGIKDQSNGPDVGVFVGIYLISIVLCFLFGFTLAYKFHRHIKQRIKVPMEKDEEYDMPVRNDKRTPKKYNVAKETELSPMFSPGIRLESRIDMPDGSPNKVPQSPKEEEQYESKKKLLRKSDEPSLAEEEEDIDCYYDACSSERSTPVMKEDAEETKTTPNCVEKKLQNGKTVFVGC